MAVDAADGQKTEHEPEVPQEDFDVEHHPLTCRQTRKSTSDKVLSETQLDVLSKGLSFVPVSPTNSFDVKTDLSRFFRKI